MQGCLYNKETPQVLSSVFAEFLFEYIILHQFGKVQWKNHWNALSGKCIMADCRLIRFPLKRLQPLPQTFASKSAVFDRSMNMKK